MRVSLWTVLRAWGRIGCTGFGGPPAHIRLLRQLVVEQRGWLDAREFEDAVAVCNLLPGPASTQLTIFCAWRVRGAAGAVVGGLAFILPGLLVILGLTVLFVAGTPPLVVLAAGAGAGGAVPAVAASAGWSLVGPSWRGRHATWRWLGYLAAGLAGAALAGSWLVLVLLACGIAELATRPTPSADASGGGSLPSVVAAPILIKWLASGAVLGSVAWEALKVGGLSFGGGFVIIPLMQADAVNRYHWMTGAQFLNAVALGQVTPGPVVQTVAVVGYAAAGIGGGLLASAVAFAPSFAFVLIGGRYFERIRGDRRAMAFLGGAAPAAIGAIFGSAITLTRELDHPWQYVVLGAALGLLFPFRTAVERYGALRWHSVAQRLSGVVFTLLAGAATGVGIALATGSLSP